MIKESHRCLKRIQLIKLERNSESNGEIGHKYGKNYLLLDENRVGFFNKFGTNRSNSPRYGRRFNLMRPCKKL